MAQKQNPQGPDDPYARESFTFRRMARWQVWSISAAVAILAVVLIAYAL